MEKSRNGGSRILIFLGLILAYFSILTAIFFLSGEKAEKACLSRPFHVGGRARISSELAAWLNITASLEERVSPEEIVKVVGIDYGKREVMLSIRGEQTDWVKWERLNSVD